MRSLFISKELAHAIKNLEREQILTLQNQQAVENHPKPKDLAEALILLNDHWILDCENQFIVSNHASPVCLAHALINLKNIYNCSLHNNIKQSLANHHAPTTLANAIYWLKTSSILTLQNLEVVAANANPESLAYALRALNIAGILNDKTRQAVASHIDPESLAHAFTSLHSFKILNQEYLEVLTTQADPIALSKDLGKFRDKAFLKMGTPPFLVLNIENNDEYLFVLNKLHSKVRKMTISKQAYELYTQTLKLLVAQLMASQSCPLSYEPIVLILDFLGDLPLFKNEALKIINNVPYPDDLLSIPQYKKSLNEKVSHCVKIQNSPQPTVNRTEQELILNLDKNNFWSNRVISPNAQQNFDKQYGLSIVS